MNTCLNCGKELTTIIGKREKKYCNNNCKQRYWQNKKPKEEKRKVLSMSEWEEIQSKLKDINDIKINDLTKPTNIIKPKIPISESKTNFTINTKPEIKIQRSFEYYKKTIDGIKNSNDWIELRRDILLADNLTTIQKQTLISIKDK